ncbi:MAG: TIGR02147 family protein [Bdellovibrionota bacterium]
MSEADHPGRPSPGQYKHYREYLRDLVVYLKAANPRFSFRYFSQRAGYASPSFLKLVIEGRRDISLQSIPRFIKGLGLAGKEAEEFEILVLLSAARTDEERNRYYTRLRGKSARPSKALKFEKAQYEIYSHWYGLPIREMLLLPDFQEDPGWIARRLGGAIAPAEAKAILRLLEETGLAVRGDGGALKAASPFLTTPPQLQSLAVRNYHRAMLERAGRAVDEIPSDQRNITSLTMSIPEALYKTICEKVISFQDEIMALIEKESESAACKDSRHEIFLFGFQLFPLTRSQGENP